ncbi:hypothetical protein DIC78_08915 [Bacillus halotolerans]|nr:hypothetical protein DIC78_08915 [Bacillus halotolerans]
MLFWRGAYTRTLLFRAESEMERGTGFKDAVLASFFKLVLRLPPINERDLKKEESKWMKWF